MYPVFAQPPKYFKSMPRFAIITGGARRIFWVSNRCIIPLHKKLRIIPCAITATVSPSAIPSMSSARYESMNVFMRRTIDSLGSTSLKSGSLRRLSIRASCPCLSGTRGRSVYAFPSYEPKSCSLRSFNLVVSSRGLVCASRMYSAVLNARWRSEEKIFDNLTLADARYEPSRDAWVTP